MVCKIASLQEFRPDFVLDTSCTNAVDIVVSHPSAATIHPAFYKSILLPAGGWLRLVEALT